MHPAHLLTRQAARAAPRDGRRGEAASSTRIRRADDPRQGSRAHARHELERAERDRAPRGVGMPACRAATVTCRSRAMARVAQALAVGHVGECSPTRCVPPTRPRHAHAIVARSLRRLLRSRRVRRRRRRAGARVRAADGGRRDGRARRAARQGRLRRFLGVVVRAVPPLVSVDERDAAEVRRARASRSSRSTSTRSAPTPSASWRRRPASSPSSSTRPGATPAAYGVKGMPSSYLIDARGNVVAVEQGFRDEQRGDAREAQLRALIAAAKN